MQSKHLAYSYIRMSTEKQIKGDSLRRQMEWSEDFARRHNLELQDASSFADIGVSAWKGSNRSKGRLGAFIQLARDGTIPVGSYLLIENLDRLSRTTPLEALDLFKEILSLGVTVVARGEWGDEETYTWQSLNTNSNQLISTLTTMLRANRESERKSQIIREAFENKRAQSRQGKKTNHAPPSWITATKLAKGEYAYSLRLRTNTAMRDFIDFISFDSITQTWTIIMFGGLRAYMFPNIKGKTAATTNVRPLVADMTQLLDQVPLTIYKDDRNGSNATMKATFDRVERLKVSSVSIRAVPKNNSTTVVGIKGKKK